MTHHRLVPSVLALVVSLGSAGLAAGGAEAAVASYVNASNIAPGHVAWIRSGPGTAYGKVGYLRAASRHIRTMDCRTIARDNWCRIEFQGTRGWIQDRYLRKPHVLQG